MNNVLLILTSLVAVVACLCIVLLYVRFRSIVSNYAADREKLVDNQKKEISRVQSEESAKFERYKTEYKEQVDNDFANKVKKRYREVEQQVRSECEAEYTQKKKDLVDDFNQKEADMKAELDEALEDGRKQLDETVKKVDEMLGARLVDIAATNTVRLNCVCSPDKQDGIDVSIDFSKDNFFTCPKCGARYQVGIKVYPILVSSVSNN